MPTSRRSIRPAAALSLPAIPEPVRFQADDRAVDAQEERHALIRLVLQLRVSPVVPRAVVAAAMRDLGSATALVRLDPDGLSARLGCPPDEADRLLTALNTPRLTDAAYAECGQLDSGPERLVGLLDAEYPALLRFAPDPPLALWVRGRLTERHGLAVSVLGSSRSAARGLEHARRFAAALTDHGVTIVNGGEAGVDEAAVDTAVGQGGRAVVALGAGLRAHGRDPQRACYERLTAGKGPPGALVSTVPLETPPDTVNQVAGDELVAWLTCACVVVRCRRNGGALIAARLAQSAGRPVLAVPGEPDDSDVRGCHHLLAKKLARPAFGPDDALAAAADTVHALTERHAQRRWLQPHFTVEHPLGPAGRGERRLISALRRNGRPAKRDALAADAELSADDAAYRLTRLRWMGLIDYEPSTQRFSLRDA